MWFILYFVLIAGAVFRSDQVGIDKRNRFILYSENTTDIYVLTDAVKLLQNNHFDNAKKTALYVHGYLETQESESVRTIVAAYRKRNDYNLIALDWMEDASGIIYVDVLPNVEKVGHAVGDALLRMIKAGLNLDRLHLIGHSLGGQMCGRVGERVKSQTGSRLSIRRISALDPAFPLFYGPLLWHLNSEHADFVDVIHTDGWVFGAPVDTGTADFYPNGGMALQPGCPPRDLITGLNPITLCSHWYSWRFWAESVANQYSNEFNAVQATSWLGFKQGESYSSNKTIVMGNDCPTRLTGRYYLQTNDAPPYARGKLGTVYHNLK